MRPKLLYTPYPTLHVENGYTQKNIDFLTELGYEVCGEPLNFKARIKFVLSMLLKREYEVAVLNWHEHLFCNRHTGRISPLGCVVFLATLVIFRLSCKQVIYIRHNVIPHALKTRSGRKLAKVLMSLGERIAGTRVSHSGHLLEEGYHYIPHPLYDLIEANLTQGEDPLPNDYFAVFGRIERYKNLLPVIQQWDNPSWLVIAGNCKDEAYIAELKHAAAGKKVKFITRFIEDNEAQAIVARARGLILSHADEDMIVSGSFFYGLSCGTEVFAVQTPFLKWLQQSNSEAPLRVFKTTDNLMTGVNSSAISPDTERRTERAIKTYSDSNFGDQCVIEAWRQVLEQR